MEAISIFFGLCLSVLFENSSTFPWSMFFSHLMFFFSYIPRTEFTLSPTIPADFFPSSKANHFRVGLTQFAFILCPFNQSHRMINSLSESALYSNGKNSASPQHFPLSSSPLDTYPRLHLTNCIKTPPENHPRPSLHLHPSFWRVGV